MSALDKDLLESFIDNLDKEDKFQKSVENVKRNKEGDPFLDVDTVSTKFEELPKSRKEHFKEAWNALTDPIENRDEELEEKVSQLRSDLSPTPFTCSSPGQSSPSGNWANVDSIEEIEENRAVTILDNGYELELQEDGVWEFGSTLQFQNNSGGAITAEVGLRLLKNGEEVRGSQAAFAGNLNNNAQRSLSSDGIILVEEEDKIVIQIYSDNASVSIGMSNIFQEPDAIFLWLTNLGSLS